MDDEEREPEMLESREILAKMLGITLTTAEDQKTSNLPPTTVN